MAVFESARRALNGARRTAGGALLRFAIEHCHWQCSSHIAGVHEVVDVFGDVVVRLEVRHVADVVENHNLGVVRHHGLRDGDFDGQPRVVLAVDEHAGHLQALQGADVVRTTHHALLGGDEALLGGLEALVFQVFDFLCQLGTFAGVEERGDEVHDISAAVVTYLLTGLHALPLLLLVVGQGVRVEQSQAPQRVGVLFGKRQGDVATHGVSHDDALLDAGILQHGLHAAGHEVHGVDVGIALAVAVARKVDSDDAHLVHQLQHQRAPDVQILHESM